MPILGSIGAGAARGLGFTSGAAKVSFEVLVIGGGGGGPQPGGGRSAGAGGFRNATLEALKGEVITVSVAGTTPARPGSGRYGGFNGGGSNVEGDGILSRYASTGGGGAGGAGSESFGKPGGSGGGGSPPGLGNQGGYTPPEGNDGGGGGGGAGAPGASGGTGASNDITGTPVTYAAGGTGGSSGLGNGGGNGQDGDSGRVIIRVATADYSSTTTGSPAVSTDGDFTVIQWTGSGSYTA